MTEPSATGRTEVAASSAQVYDLVSDLPGLSRVSAEFERGTWLGGVTEAGSVPGSAVTTAARGAAGRPR